MCLSGGCGSPERGDTIDGHAEYLRKRNIKLAFPADATVRAKSKFKLGFICVNCNFKWNARPNNVIARARPSGCPHCGNNSKRPLCPADRNCKTCLPKSLYARLDDLLKSSGLMYTGSQDARTIRASTHQKLSFIHTCGHTTEVTGCNVTSGQGCGYCSDPPKRLCPSDAECAICLRKTVAGAADALAERQVEYDAAKNPKPADQVFLQSNTSIWWRCKTEECNHTWRAPPNDVCGKQKNGCGKCASKKTEKLVYERLLELTATAQRDFRAIWCTNTTGRALPFDMAAHVDSVTGVQLDVIVEVDGAQHFGDVPFFNKSRSYEDILNIDRYKMQCALSASYHVIRVHQENAWERCVNVLAELAGVLEEIRHASAPGVWLIAEDKKVYARHSLENGQAPTQPEPTPSRKRKEPTLAAEAEET